MQPTGPCQNLIYQVCKMRKIIENASLSLKSSYEVYKGVSDAYAQMIEKLKQIPIIDWAKKIISEDINWESKCASEYILTGIINVLKIL